MRARGNQAHNCLCAPKSAAEISTENIAIMPKERFWLVCAVHKFAFNCFVATASVCVCVYRTYDVNMENHRQPLLLKQNGQRKHLMCAAKRTGRSHTREFARFSSLCHSAYLVLLIFRRSSINLRAESSGEKTIARTTNSSARSLCAHLPGSVRPFCALFVSVAVLCAMAS